ncbi:unnamed protein product [Linum trigynum]|uniref:Uncharacterized protein n=1 Tax=Linum trigynum TaxID=586398 RepID=A0AAV2CVE1_9ROSI
MATVIGSQAAVDPSLTGELLRSTTSKVEPESQAAVNGGFGGDQYPPAKNPIMSPMKWPIVVASAAVKTSVEEESHQEAECGGDKPGGTVVGHSWGGLASDHDDDRSAAVLGQGSRRAGSTIGPSNVVCGPELQPVYVLDSMQIQVPLGPGMGGLTVALLFGVGPAKQEGHEIAARTSLEGKDVEIHGIWAGDFADSKRGILIDRCKFGFKMKEVRSINE